MRKRKPILDWQVGGREDWDALEPLEVTFEEPAAVLPRAVKRRWYLRRLLRVLGAIALVVALALAYRFWRDYQENVTRVRREIQGTIDLEAWAWEQGDETLFETLIDEQAPDGWIHRFRRVQEWTRRWAGDAAQVPVVEIRNVELNGDLALVEVLVAQPGAPWATTPYRETRFYRRVEGRWLRTAPDASFWGPQRTVETEHFRFLFQQRDAEAVAGALAEVEELYAALRRDVGLGPPDADEKLTIEVVPRSNVVYWRFSDDRLTVPSPALAPVPVHLSPAARLMQSIAYPLAGRVVGEARQRTQIKFGWWPVVNGLHLWLSWEGSPLPSAWRYYVEGLLRERLSKPAPLRLADLMTWGVDRWDWQGQWMQIMAAEALVDYAVTTYGRDRLPALVQGLSQYGAWEALIPAVFGVSAEEFEAGWQAHLAARYES